MLKFFRNITLKNFKRSFSLKNLLITSIISITIVNLKFIINIDYSSINLLYIPPLAVFFRGLSCILRDLLEEAWPVTVVAMTGTGDMTPSEVIEDIIDTRFPPEHDNSNTISPGQEPKPYTEPKHVYKYTPHESTGPSMDLYNIIRSKYRYAYLFKGDIAAFKDLCELAYKCDLHDEKAKESIKHLDFKKKILEQDLNNTNSPEDRMSLKNRIIMLDERKQALKLSLKRLPDGHSKSYRTFQEKYYEIEKKLHKDHYEK